MRTQKRKKLIIQVLIICVISALVMTILMYGLRLDTVFGEDRKLPIYYVDTKDKKVAISFDCAWGNEHTKPILDILDQYNVKTTFFMVRFWAEKFPEDVLEIHNRGHEIGNHSSTHPNMTKLSIEDITKELKDTEDVIVNIIDKKPTLFRPPFGAYNNMVIETCETDGYHVIQWNVDSLDWKDITAEQIVDRVTRNAVPGSIILFHNNAEHVEEYLPSILSRLQSDGYEVVPIGQLIIKENYHIDHAGKQVAN